MGPKWRRTFLVLATAAVVALGIQSVRKGLRAQGFDLHSYLEAAAKALAGATPYGFEDVYFPYLYPPFFAGAMVPFTLVPEIVAIVLWYALSVWALFWSLRQIARWTGWLDRPPDRGLTIAIALLAVALFRVVHSNLTNGQVNLILLGMCVAACEADRRDRPIRAGAWLALAIQTKVMPVLLIGHFALRRRFRTLASTLAFGAIFGAVPLLFWGSDTLEIYREYRHQVTTRIAEGTIDNGLWTVTHLGYIEYFSLQGFLAQVIPALPHGRGLEYCCLAAVLLGLVVAEWAGRGWPARGTLFALYLAAALLVTPFAEKHHLALLFPALALTAFARHHDALSRTLGIGAVSCLLLSKPWPSGPFYFFAICAAAAAAWRCAVLAARAAPPK